MPDKVRAMKTRSNRWHSALGTVLLLAAVMLSGKAIAQTQSYDVELVIFRHLSNTGTAERWDQLPDSSLTLELPDDEPGSATEAPPSTINTTASYPPLAQSQLKLTAIADSLRRSRNYQPIAHVGWTQPGFPRNAASYVLLENMVTASSGLSGKIALTRGRYLHLTLDIALDAAATAAEPAQRYVLRQSRRMRSNERHYIDHPKIGVIAIVTPTGGG